MLLGDDAQYTFNIGKKDKTVTKTVVLETTRGGLCLNDNLFDVYNEVYSLVGRHETAHGLLQAAANKIIYLQLLHMPKSGVDDKWREARCAQVLKHRREVKEMNEVQPKKQKQNQPITNFFS